MSIIGEPVFMGRADIGDLARHVEGQLREKVESYDTRKFDTQTDAQVVAALVDEVKVDPLVVDFDNGSKAVDEITMSVRDVFGGQTQVPGYRVSKTFKFTGDAELWKFGTGQWSSSMPYAKVSRDSVTVGMEVRTSDANRAADHINETVKQIQHYLGVQRQTLDEFNASLPGRLLPLVQARRSRRGGAESLLDKF